MIRALHIWDGSRWRRERKTNRQSLPTLTLTAWRTTGRGWAYAIIAPHEPESSNDLPGMLVARAESQRKAFDLLRVLQSVPIDLVLDLVREYGSISLMMQKIPRAQHMLRDPISAAVMLFGMQGRT